MIYKDEIRKGMELLAKNPRTVFIGYNLAYGSRNYGSMVNIARDRIIETPVAESLMMGLGIGMALEGYLPVVVYERIDFVLLALDQLVNHLDKIKTMSQDEFNPKVIVKITVGGHHPFDAGIQHTRDYTDLLFFYAKLIEIDRYSCIARPSMISVYYKTALKNIKSSIIIDYRDNYEHTE